MKSNKFTLCGSHRFIIWNQYNDSTGAITKSNKILSLQVMAIGEEFEDKNSLKMNKHFCTIQQYISLNKKENHKQLEYINIVIKWCTAISSRRKRIIENKTDKDTLK